MSAEEGEPRWYVLSTKRGKEVLVSKALERVCAEVFLPLLYETKPGHKPQPGFPRLIFVRVDLKSRFFDVAYSPGILDLLNAIQPTEVSDSLMLELKAAATARYKQGSEAAAVSDSVRRLFDPEIASLGRLVALVRMIEDRKHPETSGCNWSCGPSGATQPGK
jgi:transcription antitermination factor NusG